MLPTLFAATALAGTIHVQSESPVSWRFDGEVVATVVMRAEIEDVGYGHHILEVVDTLGRTIASADVMMDELPLFYEYADQRLDRLDPTRMGLEELGLDNPAIDMEDFLALRRALTSNQRGAKVKGVSNANMSERRDKKKMKILVGAANHYWFEMRQVNEVLGAFDTLAGRVAAAVVLAPKTVDPQKFEAIAHHFEAGAYLDRARLAFAQETDPE